uniref:SHSP domain-containing protein n=1 Tax=Neogobius melanostomus TaxID=47308 RepID=A0A8C6WFL0_9GOBI
MSQQSAMSSLFADDPFFSQDRLLWPLRSEALSSIQQDFFNRRAKLADSLFMELHDGPHLPLMSAAFPSYDGCFFTSTEQSESGDLLVTLDARGYAPSDITVKVEGRSLAVSALKQAGAEESESCASATSRAAFMSTAAANGLSCSLMDNGQLRIHAPAVKKQPITEEGEEEEVPGRFRSSLEFPIKKDKTEGQATD